MVSRIPSRGSDQFNLRFPDGMRERIRASAEENGRSMNAEIIYRLQTTLEMDSYVPQENIHPDDGMSDEALYELALSLMTTLQKRMGK